MDCVASWSWVEVRLLGIGWFARDAYCLFEPDF